MATIPGHIDQLEMDLRSMRLNYKRGEMTINEALLALGDITKSLVSVKSQTDAVYNLVLASTTQHHVKEVEESYRRISEIADSIKATALQVGTDVVVMKVTEKTKSQVSA